MVASGFISNSNRSGFIPKSDVELELCEGTGCHTEPDFIPANHNFAIGLIWLYSHDAFTQKKSYLVSNANKNMYIKVIRISDALATDAVMESVKLNWSPKLTSAETIKALGACLILTEDSSYDVEKAYLR